MIIDGQEWVKCCAEYESDGKKYVFDFYATSFDHAAVMLQDIKETAVLTGINVEDVKR